jgi:hypothetical protein
MAEAAAEPLSAPPQLARISAAAVVIDDFDPLIERRP